MEYTVSCPSILVIDTGSQNKCRVFQNVAFFWTLQYNDKHTRNVWLYPADHKYLRISEGTKKIFIKLKNSEIFVPFNKSWEWNISQRTKLENDTGWKC